MVQFSSHSVFYLGKWVAKWGFGAPGAVYSWMAFATG